MFALPEAVEVRSARTPHSKTFMLAKPGQYRVVSETNELHFGHQLEDVDLRWQERDGKFRVRSAAYMATFDPATCTLHYRLRVGGDISVRIVSVGGDAPLPGKAEVFEGGTKIRLPGIGHGVSLVVAAKDRGPEVFRLIARPCRPEIVWAVDATPELSRATNLLRMTGHDNHDFSAASRPPTTSGRVRREVEIQAVKSDDVFADGRCRYTVTERLTGRTKYRDPKTRVPRWVEEIALPALLDVQVTATMAANGDDGCGYTAGASELWYIARNYFDGSNSPAWRFTSLNVPQGATIDAATIGVYVVTANAGPTASLYGEAVDNAAAWGNGTANGPNRMTKTTAFITFGGFSATGSTTRNCPTIVQEIVNRGGWVSGNALRMGCTPPTGGSGVVFADREYNPSLDAILTVDYTAGGAPAKKGLMMIHVGLLLPFAPALWRFRRMREMAAAKLGWKS